MFRMRLCAAMLAIAALVAAHAPLLRPVHPAGLHFQHRNSPTTQRYPEKWPFTPDGKLAMYTRPLDLESLLGESSAELSDPGGAVLGTGPADL